MLPRCRVLGFRTDRGRAGVLLMAGMVLALLAAIAVGPASTTSARLTSRIAVAQLPGGGRVLFPRHLLVALYGHPGAPALGALGQQGLQASIARARKVAAAYQPLTSSRVIPAFEIIATVARWTQGRSEATDDSDE